MTTLICTVELKTDTPALSKPIWVRMIVANASDQVVSVVNPDFGRPPPDLHWTGSNEAYSIGVLMSFGFLEITLTDPVGTPVERKSSVPWITPVVGRLLLQPGESCAFNFDLAELFLPKSAGRYETFVRYGDDAASCNTTMGFDIGENQPSLNRAPP